jgi:hypothetical protein
VFPRPHHTTPHHTTPHQTTPHHTTPHHTTSDTTPHLVSSRLVSSPCVTWSPQCFLPRERKQYRCTRTHAHALAHSLTHSFTTPHRPPLSANRREATSRQAPPNDGLQPNPTKFPHGMKYMADQLHAHGLVLGLYTVPGNYTCSGEDGGGELGRCALVSLIPRRFGASPRAFL